jgi:hypothetical protein
MADNYRMRWVEIRVQEGDDWFTISREVEVNWPGGELPGMISLIGDLANEAQSRYEDLKAAEARRIADEESARQVLEDLDG